MRKVQPGRCSQNRGLWEPGSGLGVCGARGFPEETLSEQGLESQAVSWPSGEGAEGREVTPARGNSMSATGVQAVAKRRNVFCTFLVSDKQRNYPICSTECSVKY